MIMRKAIKVDGKPLNVVDRIGFNEKKLLEFDRQTTYISMANTNNHESGSKIGRHAIDLVVKLDFGRKC